MQILLENSLSLNENLQLREKSIEAVKKVIF